MRFARYLVVLLSLGFMTGIVVDLWPQLRDTDYHLQGGALLLSLTMLVLLFVLDAFGWLIILSSLAHSPPHLESIRIWLLSSIARYIPGGIWSYVSRAEMTSKQGVDLPSISVALFLETLLLAASSFVAGLPALIIANGYSLGWWQPLLLVVATMIVFHPASLQLLQKLPGKLGKSFSRINLPSFRQMAGLYLYYLIFWCLFGVAFVVFVNMLHPLTETQWLPVASSIGLSFFSGFVMVFVPGGIGVRESVLYLLLTPVIPAPDALLIAIGSRIWIMAGEGLSLFLIEILFHVKKRNTGSVQP